MNPLVSLLNGIAMVVTTFGSYDYAIMEGAENMRSASGVQIFSFLSTTTTVTSQSLYPTTPTTLTWIVASPLSPPSGLSWMAIRLISFTVLLGYEFLVSVVVARHNSKSV